MKYDEHGKECQNLLKKKPIQLCSITNEDYPLLTSKFLTFLKIMNTSILAYILISSGFYLIIHFYGKEIIKTKSLRLDYDLMLYHNLFINIFFLLTTTFGYLTINRKSLSSFFTYFFLLLLYTTIFSISLFTNLFSDFFVNKKLVWFSYTIIFMTFSLLSYCVFHFFQVIELSRRNLNNITTSGIIHEVNLRSDMFKFSFNNLMIRTKLHKFLPSLMFKKDSYYFTTLAKKKNADEIDVNSTMYNTNSE